MANKKFSQFDDRTDYTQVDALVGYQGLDNIKIDPSLLVIPNQITVIGIWKNLFGGSPGIFGDTLEFAASASPVASNSSVFVIPFDCELVSASLKWIHATPITIPAPAVWDVFVYKLNSPNVSTTASTNYTQIDKLDTLTLSSSDNTTFPFKSWDGTISFTKGDIINVSGVESGGSISTEDAEVEAFLTFKEVI